MYVDLAAAAAAATVALCDSGAVPLAIKADF